MKQVNTEKQHICEASCSVDGRFVPRFFRNFADIVTFYTTQNVSKSLANRHYSCLLRQLLGGDKSR
jgi:hypothetical protein